MEKRKKFLISKRKRKVGSARMERNKKQGAGFYTVSCMIHGKKMQKEQDYWLRVAPPRNRYERFYKGCPLCNGGLR